MELYTLKNQLTGETKNFMKKTNLAKTIGVNIDKVELAIMKNQPINKRNGEKYHVEYRDVNIGLKLEDN